MRAAEGFARNQTASETWNGIGPKRAANATQFTVLSTPVNAATARLFPGAVAPKQKSPEGLETQAAGGSGQAETPPVHCSKALESFSTSRSS